MTENDGQKGTTESCCGDETRKDCCEQMMKMMHNHCGDGEKGFDCASMMQKMSCTPHKQDDSEQ